MNGEALEKLGEILMKRVRDKAIGEWEKLVAGEMKGLTAERLKQLLSASSPREKEIILKLLPQIVDTVLHHLLWTLEQEQSLTLLAQDKYGNAENVRDASDGLAGELYGDRGWISRFSTKGKSGM